MFDKYLKIEFRKQMALFALLASCLLVFIGLDPFSFIYYILNCDSRLFFYLIFGDSFVSMRVMYNATKY